MNSPGLTAGVWSLYILRPEGPIVARPGRKAGIKMEEQMSAEGAAHEAPMVSRLQRSIAS
jgi:hypothetical protein